ncbi:MAG: BTAD domain-containing putative transcriptional regulator, partial [Acidimicrobiia bacterium]|nr:BTAD domain-containing putative transcriptional regulator [Acidimicrobiia bacterium]
ELDLDLAESTADNGQEVARLLGQSLGELDWWDRLPAIDVPTLVVHRTGDKIIPVEYGIDLAQSIPGARLLLQEGDDHFGYAGDVKGWMDEVERFVTGTVQPRPAPAPRSSDVRIATLGGFRVTVGGAEVPTGDWGSRLARHLLKRLVAARGTPVTRDELFDMLWPDERDRHRLGPRLSVLLSTVRRVLGTGVVADRESVRLDLDEISIDLQDFYTAGDDAAIVAAYGGEFLPEDVYEDWTAPYRDEARNRFVTAARTLAGIQAERGSHRIAIDIGHRLIGIDPYDEDAHRMIVTSLAALGEESAARRAHHAWTEALGELDITVESYEAVAGS